MRNPVTITLLALAARTATVNADPQPILNPQNTYGFSASAPVADVVPCPAVEVLGELNVTVAPGIDTVLLKMQGREPISGTWNDIPGAATLAQVATGIIRLRVGVGITSSAPSAADASLNIALPANWRFTVVHSAGTSFTYSLSATVEQRG